MVDGFYFFSYFSGLKPNSAKSESAGIGILKGVQVAVCGMRCIDLKNDTLNILATHFACNEKLKEEKKFYKTVADIQRVLEICKMRNLQKQPPRGVLEKRCSENMQQIYRRTPMPKCDFNKVAKQL